MQDDTPETNFRASNFQRYALCPASWKACQGMGEGPESDDARKGKLVHDIVEKGYILEWAEVPSSESDEPEIIYCAQQCLEQLRLTGIEGDEIQSEVNMSCNINDSIVSGHIDILVVCAKNAHIIDLKTGHGDQVEAAGNAQLRTYAWLLYNIKKYDTITCWIVQPHRVTSTTYTAETMADIDKEIRDIVECCLDKRQLFNPGELQCRYCRARGTERCEASMSLVKKFSQEQSIDIARLPKLLDLALTARSIIDKLVDDAKELLMKDPDCIPGFELRASGFTKTVELGDAFNLLPKDIAQNLQNSSNTSLSKIIEVTMNTMRIKKNEATKLATEYLDGFINVKEKSPSLKQIK